MTLADFHTRVSTHLRRGSQLDAEIASYVKSAARWLEQNYTFDYMKKFVSFTIDADAATPRKLALPSDRFKAIEFVRIVNDDSTYSYLKKVQAKEITEYPSEKPKAYWISGMSAMYLNSVPDEDYSCEMEYSEFTAWPSSTAATPLLLQHYEDLLLYQTLYMFAALMRDRENVPVWKNLRDEFLRVATLAQQEREDSNEEIYAEYVGVEPEA